MQIEIKLLTETAIMPNYQTEGAAAFDLHADTDCSICIYPGDHKTISTGIAIHIEKRGYVGLIYSRSGMGFKYGIVLRNGTGVIDSDYQGEINVCLLNTSDQSYIVEPQERIAQMIITPVLEYWFDVVDEFTLTSQRGTDGIGSTGK